MALIPESVILIRDLEADEWTARLRRREGLMVWQMFVSRDSRWLAVLTTGQHRTGSARPELLLYDLTDAIDHR